MATPRRGEGNRHAAGARYGERVVFNEYVRRAALAMGQEAAERVLFVADGAKTNWQIRADNFPGATEVLDFYHAAEHLGEFCGSFENASKGQRQPAMATDAQRGRSASTHQ
jgi:hypothetical protein